ncbi:MAG: hypothetical protein EKK41_02635 [Hyphomicrobiales bacterium]|nr:MAG: hypothetical protein EKK41_02635 [Hyphomicrobiales bacterium]
MRIVLENVLLFLLPTLVYCGIRYLRSEKRALGSVLNEAPLVLLFVCGAVLVGGLRIYAAATAESGRPDQEYVPPHMGKDGKIEPGRMK